MSFWKWAAYAITGAITVSLFPAKDRVLLILLLFLGGTLYLARNGGSIQDLIATLENNK